MYIQHCVKGIAGPGQSGPGISEEEARAIVDGAHGIRSNWWRAVHTITPAEVAQILTETNLDRHLHDYDRYGAHTPFISLSCGSVERDAVVRHNFVYAAIDIALMFATEDWSRPGALFFCWVPTSFNRSVALGAVAEPVRDITIYQRWSPFQLEGEITAKVHIPANQIARVEWWDGAHSQRRPVWWLDNAGFVSPDALSNIRELF